MMFGVMNVADQVEKPGILFDGPLSDLASKVIDGTKQVEAAYDGHLEACFVSFLRRPGKLILQLCN